MSDSFAALRPEVRHGEPIIIGTARSGVRVVEGARLEIVYTATYRGFESHPLRQSLMMILSPTPEERLRRDGVLAVILRDVRLGTTIKLPPFDPLESVPSDQFALISVGVEPNEYGSTVGPFRYQFEGEDDLLHLMITRLDGSPLSPSESQEVVDFLYPGVPTALMWLKPATYSQHFYLGHDVLLEYLA